MRTKNVKRLWPVPVTLGVMALAALLAFGLMATNGAEPAAAQDDPDCAVQIAANDNNLSLDGTCNISGTEATIALEGYETEPTGDNADTEVTYFVYGSDVGEGGTLTTIYPPHSRYFHTAATGAECKVLDEPGGIQAQVDSADVADVAVGAKSVVDYKCDIVSPLQGKSVKIDAPGISGASSVVLSIAGEPLTESPLYVFFGRPTGTVDLTEIDTIDNADDTREVNAITAMEDREAAYLNIKFLGPPATKRAADGMPASKLEAKTEDSNTPGEYIIINGSNEKMARISALDEVRVAATVQDANGDALAGTITYSVEFVDGSSLLSGRSSYPGQPETFDPGDSKGTGHDVRGWASKGPVNAKVTVAFTGGTGSIALGPLALIRPGNLDGIEADVCVHDSDDEVKTDTCGENSRARTVFPPGETFRVPHMPVDMLGTELMATDASARSSVTPPDAKTEKGADVISTATEATVDEILGYDDDPDNDVETLPPDRPTVASDDWYTIHADTPPGIYDITVKASQVPGGKRVTEEMTLTITVGGDPAMYDLSGPESIALTSFASAEYTIKATDAAGNTPAFDDDEAMVSVVVESGLSVRITGLDDGMVTLDPETGEVMFTVYKPANAMRGDTASIGIFVGDELMDQLTVNFGEPFMAPGMPMSVMAEATSDSEITVSWESPADDGSSDITGYMVQSAYMMADDMMSDWMDVDPAHMGMDMMYMDSGLMAETTYYYRVAAMNSVGMGEYSDGTAMAMTMTMMMPPMELGQAMDLTAMANADGSITLMFTPGTSATHHFVSGNVSAIWEYADGMNRHTVSTDQLTSGMEYKFYVLSGQWEEMADGTWEGMWAAEGWSNAAMSTAN